MPKAAAQLQMVLIRKELVLVIWVLITKNGVNRGFAFGCLMQKSTKLNHHHFFQLRGFPASITSKAMLANIVTRLIWTSSAQHTAVNYPITAYGAFTPNMPTKMYDDDRVAPEVFNPFRLPNGFVSAVSIKLINKITVLLR